MIVDGPLAAVAPTAAVAVAMEEAAKLTPLRLIGRVGAGAGTECTGASAAGTGASTSGLIERAITCVAGSMASA